MKFPKRSALQTIRSNGFTLIETLLAVFILLVGVVTGFGVILQSVRVSPGARQELIAANLAQEAVEILRNMRDARLLAIADKLKQATPVPLVYPTDSWSVDLNVCPVAGQRKRIELVDNNNFTLGWQLDSGCAIAGDRPKVYQHTATGFYANCNGPNCPAGWVDSGFRRVMRLEKYACSDAVCTSLVNTGNACDNDNSCAEVRVKVHVYWNTNVEPICPGPGCLILEDRLTKWTDYMESFL